MSYFACLLQSGGMTTPPKKRQWSQEGFSIGFCSAMIFKCIHLFPPCSFQFSATVLVIIWLLWYSFLTHSLQNSFLSVLPSPSFPQYPDKNLSPDPRISWDSMKGFIIPTPTLNHIGLLFCTTVVDGVTHQSDMYFVYRPGRLPCASLPVTLQTCVFVVNSVHWTFPSLSPVSKIMDVYLNSSGNIQALKGERLVLNCTATGKLNTRVNITWDYPGKVRPNSCMKHWFFKLILELILRYVSSISSCPRFLVPCRSPTAASLPRGWWNTRRTCCSTTSWPSPGSSSQTGARTHVTSAVGRTPSRSKWMLPSTVRSLGGGCHYTEFPRLPLIPPPISDRPFIRLKPRHGSVIEVQAGQKAFRISPKLRAFPQPEIIW